MKKEKKRTYNDIINDLENIIKKLNAKNIPLENSIKLYEEGIKISNEAEKELLQIEKNIHKTKKPKKNSLKKINIEKSFDEIESIIEMLEDEDIDIEKAAKYHAEALDIIFEVESYLIKAKSIIKKYE